MLSWNHGRGNQLLQVQIRKTVLVTYSEEGTVIKSEKNK